ncbi:zinc finger protein 768-like [Sipha flava]|jgi:KRAB domain-containing zinc finger protein|uniref:Zinc finger protein 768-like n=1 Tax=Sipha flava TaxID=143950 RepID=A0A8B8F7E1_9HEMI|nr:zinc finger protein 768-like [Sipha flava]
MEAHGDRVLVAAQDQEQDKGGGFVEPVLKPFRCWSCLSRIISYPKLVDHMRTNHSDKPKVCPWCPAAFLEKSLVLHVDAVHGRPGPGSPASPVCGDTYKQGSTAADHEKAHRGAAPYACSVCHRAFTRRNNLAEHVRSHIRLKSCLCAVCGKTYVRPGYLDKHIRTKHGFKAP